MLNIRCGRPRISHPSEPVRACPARPRPQEMRSLLAPAYIPIRGQFKKNPRIPGTRVRQAIVVTGDRQEGRGSTPSKTSPCRNRRSDIPVRHASMTGRNACPPLSHDPDASGSPSVRGSKAAIPYHNTLSHPLSVRGGEGSQTSGARERVPVRGEFDVTRPTRQ